MEDHPVVCGVLPFSLSVHNGLVNGMPHFSSHRLPKRSTLRSGIVGVDCAGPIVNNRKKFIVQGGIPAGVFGEVNTHSTLPGVCKEIGRILRVNFAQRAADDVGIILIGRIDEKGMPATSCS